MTLILQRKLPAISLLDEEGIFAKIPGQEVSKSLPTLNIGLLNLMPNKVETEVQILRLLDTPNFNIRIHLLKTATYKSKNTSPEYLDTFSKTYKDVDEEIDGLIITGADVEFMKFEEVAYWDELQKIMNWAEQKVRSTFFICWAAQAGVYHHYGIDKHMMKKKLSGVFRHEILLKDAAIAYRLEVENLVPHSRYTELHYSELLNIPELEIISVSKEAGVYLVSSRDGKKVFATGHSEYNAETIKQEYLRDLKKGINPSVPTDYFPDNNPAKRPKAVWRKHSQQLLSNWLYFYVNR